jgi:hypothetical protein
MTNLDGIVASLALNYMNNAVSRAIADYVESHIAETKVLVGSLAP